jgi:VCBS repeat-containing protein
MRTKLLAISAIALAITGCDSDDTVPEVGNSFGSLVVSGDAIVGQTLSTTVSDDNGLANATISYAWSANGTVLSGQTSGSLTLTDTLIGDEISVSVSYTDDDGFDETITSDATDAVVSSNNSATFSGDVTGTLANNTSAPITGTITVTDTDEGESTIVAQTDATATYGTFSITTAGVWTYTLDTTNTTVAGLADENDTVTESITITSADGTALSIDITISGVAPDKVAQISDSVDSDTGELYYKFSSGVTTGKLSLSILYGEDETETAYISLYDTEGSTKSLIGELALNEGEYGLRVNTFTDGSVPSKSTSASSSIDTDAIDAPNFTPGEWIDVVMTWDTSSTTDAGTYSVIIDEVTYGPFVSQHPTPGVLVESMTIRLSSNGGTSTDAIYVNDLNIYSDVDGTAVILEENFEGFTLGDSLEEGDSSPFGSRTFESVVVIYGADDATDGDGEGGAGEVGDDPTPGTAGNKIVVITDTDTEDTGELRVKLSTSDIIVKGKMTASFSKTASTACTLDSSVKDAYVGLYGSSTSSYDAIVDLRIDGSDYDTAYAIRKNNVSGDKTVDIAGITFSADTWTKVEVTWDATDATDTTAPLISLSLDGTAVTTEAWNSYSATPSTIKDGAQTFTFRLGDNGANIPDCKFRVDNIKIYSTDTAGTDTLEFQDNFESYADGDSLNPADEKSTKYNSATQEAVIVIE